MTTESTEELRERLLRDHEVQEMIRMRAYEIYRHRGGAPGGHAEDWFQAESEVLHFLIEEESRRVVEVEVYTETITPIETAAASASGPQAESAEAAPKKPRARKAKAKAADAAEGAPKKAATKRAAAKKTPDSTAKPKRSRKKSEDVTPTE